MEAQTFYFLAGNAHLLLAGNRMTATMVKLVEAQPLRDATYVAAAIACLIVGLVLEQRSGDKARDQANFWLSLSTVLLVLAAMKVFGVQDDVMHRVRQFAWHDGWYSTRRPLQARVILGILVAVGIFLTVTLYKLHSLRISLGAPVVSATLLITFLVIRAISLHQVDSVIYRSNIKGVQVSALAELSLVALVMAIAVITGLVYLIFGRTEGHEPSSSMLSSRPMALATASMPAVASPARSDTPVSSTSKSRRKKKRKR